MDFNTVKISGIVRQEEYFSIISLSGRGVNRLVIRYTATQIQNNHQACIINGAAYRHARRATKLLWRVVDNLLEDLVLQGQVAVKAVFGLGYLRVG